nr:phage portal protein [uncultured Anaerostipes sp.]DAV04003.1 MAG TPA: portal protein [Caudoviricetes sp.]
MIKEIIERIRQVIRKMLGKENIRDAIGVDVAVSDKMAREIDLWSKMYKNKPPWKRKELKLCGLPAAIAGEFARLVTLELKTEITGNKFLNDEYQTVIDNIRTYTEYACAKGGLAMKPYVSDGHIEVDMVQADRFFPVKFNSRGEVIAAVFMETVTIGKQVYTRLEYHRHDEKTATYYIINKAFVRQDLDNVEVLGKEVPLSAVPEWADLEETVTIINVKRPLFAYFKIPNANNVDDSSPLGVSVYSRAVDDIKEADYQWTRILWEFEGSELAIDGDVSLFKRKENGEFDLPKGKERLFRMMDFDDDKEQYKVFAPPIRDESLINGFNAILRRVEFNSGLAYGTLSDLNTVDKTAEEIKTSKQRSYSTVSDIQKALQKALEQLIYAMDVIAQLSNLNGGKKYEVSFDWDDSIVIDKEQELQSMQQDATAGLIRKEIYIAAKYGVSEEEALKMMPAQDDRFTIQEE